MKITRTILIAVLSSIALLVTACGMATGGAPQAGESVAVTIGVPAVSSRLLAAFAAAKALPAEGEASKALLFATRARIKVFEGTGVGGNVAFDSLDMNPSQTNPGMPFASTASLTIGAGYTAEVQVWNTAVDAINRILYNTKYFVVQPVGNEVRVPLLPQLSLNMDNFATFSLYSSVYSDNGTPAVSTDDYFSIVGGEDWFHFFAGAEVVQIVATPMTSSDSVYMALYDANGEQLSDALSPNFTGGADSFATIVKGLTTGSLYYIGLIEANGIESASYWRDGSISITNNPVGYDDFDETLGVSPNNDFMAWATPYPSFGVVPASGAAYDEDWWEVIVPSAFNVPIWFQFDSPASGKLEIYDWSGVLLDSDQLDSQTGKTVFSVTPYLTPGTYYVRGDFYARGGAMGFKVPAGAYSFGAGIAVPAGPLALSPPASAVKRGRLLVNENQPDLMTYVWIDNGVGGLHAVKSFDGGQNWNTETAYAAPYARFNDFAADVDASGNAVIVALESTYEDGSTHSNAYYTTLPSGSTSFSFLQYIFGNDWTGGGHYNAFSPSVFRGSTGTLYFGYGFDMSNGPDYTNAHYLTWNGSMGGYNFISLYDSIAVDNPWNQQISADASGSTPYYLYQDNVFGYEGQDIIVKYQGGDTVVVNSAYGNTADQPWMTPFGSDLLLLYTDWTTGFEPNLVVKVGNQLSGLASATPYSIATGVAYCYTTGGTAPRTMYALKDAYNNVFVAYQGTDGNVYGLKLNSDTYMAPGSPILIASAATLDGLALDSFVSSSTRLYLSTHDGADVAKVDMIDTSAW